MATFSFQFHTFSFLAFSYFSIVSGGMCKNMHVCAQVRMRAGVCTCDV